jgi:putative ABC transport system substrate-binding protein
LVVIRIGDVKAIEQAFATFAGQKIDALRVGADGFFNNHASSIIALAKAYEFREFVAEGGLLSYGPSLMDAYRFADLYIGRILKARRQPPCHPQADKI